MWPFAITYRTNSYLTIGNTPDATTIASVRYPFMNTQDQASLVRTGAEVFTTERHMLSPKQQIGLHIGCLLREHIRRALSPILS
jgi:hypothetical protein